MKPVIYSYNGAGASMRFLSHFLGNAEILNKYSLPTNWRGKVLINYGASYLTLPWDAKWLNSPDAIRNAVHKLVAFRLFDQHGVAHPEYTQNNRLAEQWVAAGDVVYARSTSTGSEGRGISILKDRNAFVPCVEFYSKALHHDDEFRVHVVKGKVVSVGKKYAKERNANPFIRNMDNGWAFRLNVDAPESVKRIGKKAIAALGMDFGAADVGYVQDGDKPYVFEVNSAPTMAEMTAQVYARAFLDYIESL